MMRLDFEKQNGLIPCIVQDVDTKKVLMLGYMNKESYDKTLKTKKTKNKLAQASFLYSAKKYILCPLINVIFFDNLVHPSRCLYREDALRLNHYS